MEIIQAIIDFAGQLLYAWLQGAWAVICGVAQGLWNNPIILITLAPFVIIPAVIKGTKKR